tara:strand:- start:147 stop:353 length:207 start_codon:yes stop_codon:yes gene_type:complete
MVKSKHWSEITEEGVDVDIGEENQASRDQHGFAHTNGKRIIQKEKHRIPRFTSKIEEAIWIAQQKSKQ